MPADEHRSDDLELNPCPVESGPIELERCPSFAAKKDFPIASFILEGGITQDEYTLKPGEKVQVTYKIGPENLEFGTQNYLPKVEAETLTRLHISTRSFRAQSGIFVYLDKDKPLTKKQIEEFANGGEIEVIGHLKNIGQSPHVLKKGDAVGRFYWTNESELIRGRHLKELLQQGLVGPKNWRLINDHTVAVKVAPHRFHIPNLPGGTPHRFDTRQEFGLFSGYMAPHGQALEEASHVDTKHDFHLLVTHEKLDLPGNVMGVLSPKTDLPGVEHYPSLLIDPNSKWPIRLEILGGHPEWVHFTFYKTDNCPARLATDEKAYNIYAK